MERTIKTLALGFVLAATGMLLQTSTVNGGNRERHSYRIPLYTQGDGSIQAKQALVSLPSELVVNSTPEIESERRDLLAWHFRNAAQAAHAFAAKEKLEVHRANVPGAVEIFYDPSGVAAATGLPRSEGGMTAVARIDLNNGIVYLGRKTPMDLYTELGKWFFYAPDYRWGQQRLEDLKMLRRAERFARFCLDAKNWNEKGGSAGSLW